MGRTRIATFCIFRSAERASPCRAFISICAKTAPSSKMKRACHCPTVQPPNTKRAVTAAEIGRDRLPEGGLQSVTVDVRDENGDNLLSVTVSLTVTQSTQQAGGKGRSRSGDTEEGAGPP